MAEISNTLVSKVMLSTSMTFFSMRVTSPGKFAAHDYSTDIQNMLMRCRRCQSLFISPEYLSSEYPLERVLTLSGGWRGGGCWTLAGGGRRGSAAGRRAPHLVPQRLTERRRGGQQVDGPRGRLVRRQRLHLTQTRHSDQPHPLTPCT